TFPSKSALWSSLVNLIVNWDKNLVVMGGFNEVREAGKRFGSVFKEIQANIFRSKMSKLDQFLISESFYEVLPRVTGVVLEIDAKVDQGCASEEDVINRRDSRKIMGDIDHLEAKDIAQKTKIKWAFEGDENTSFFYGTLKKKRRQLAIKGILKKWRLD
ncbi:hypothetical protein Tco_1440445, partial [Tanacetum coccineum]